MTFNPYGDTVFVIKPTDKKDEKGNVALQAQQVFVTTGPTRGDQVAILKGLDPGAEVVSSGQVKLKNGARVVVEQHGRPIEQPEPDGTGTLGTNMNFTDLFIRKPVLAMTISLLILVLGVRSLVGIAVRQYPKTRERRRNHQHRVLRRGRADGCRLHHPAARRCDRAGPGHRLSFVDQRFRRFRRSRRHCASTTTPIAR